MAGLLGILLLGQAALNSAQPYDDLCSLNGRLGQDGKCICDIAWNGPQCELLTLLPVPKGSDYNAPGVSTWGASIVQLPHDPAWHMYVSEFLEGCGVTSWQTNSQIVHAVSDSPTGPWQRMGMSLHAWSHCGTVAVAPDGVMIQPRLWCSPEKYGPGEGTCNAGVRSEIPSGMPNAGQRCSGGTSPCGFHMHEGTWVPCRNASDAREFLQQRLRQRRHTMPCEPGLPASVSFAVTRQAAGEWLENFTAPIVGPNLCPRNHSMGTNPPWIMKNGTTFILVLPQIIRADVWNGSYRVWAENVTIPGGEDPYLWVTESGHFHLLYHRMNDGQQTGGHGYSADGKYWTWGPPAYDASVRYEDPLIGRRSFASRERPHLVWGRREEDGELEIVALTTGVKVCNFRNSTVDECNSNSWPGYNDAAYTSVQPIHSSRALLDVVNEYSGLVV